MKPEPIDYLLDKCGPFWLGGQRALIRETLRQYIHDLETRCDPAGDIHALTFAKDQVRMLEASNRRLRDAQPVVIGQTNRQTMVEVLVGTSIGYVVALMSQVFLMWLYGLPSTFGQDVGITLFFTGISILRGYAVRRYFNWRHHGNTSNRRP